MPAKLQSYLAIGKPIIGLLAGEGADIIKKSKCGITYENNDISMFVNKIADFISLNNSELNEMGKNGHNFYKLNFSSNIRKTQLFNLFKQ